MIIRVLLLSPHVPPRMVRWDGYDRYDRYNGYDGYEGYEGMLSMMGMMGMMGRMGRMGMLILVNNLVVRFDGTKHTPPSTYGNHAHHTPCPYQPYQPDLF